MDQTPQTECPFKGKTGLRRLINTLYFSIAGFKAAFEEQGFRQLIYLNTVLIIVALALNFDLMTRALLIIISLGTLIIELFNTAIEAAVDHTSLEKHPLAKRAKDTASAAQMLGLITLAITWLFALLHTKPWQVFY